MDGAKAAPSTTFGPDTGNSPSDRMRADQLAETLRYLEGLPLATFDAALAGAAAAEQLGSGAICPPGI